jgi:hypothetical protein
MALLLLTSSAFAQETFKVTVSGTDKETCVKALVNQVLSVRQFEPSFGVPEIRERSSWHPWFGRWDFHYPVGGLEIRVWPYFDRSAGSSITCGLSETSCNGATQFKIWDKDSSSKHPLFEINSEEDNRECPVGDVGPS